MAKDWPSAHRTDETLARAFRAGSAQECANLLAGASDRFDVFREALPFALRGEWSAVVVVVGRWHGLVDDVLATAADERPELVRRIGKNFEILTASHSLSDEPVRYLDEIVSEVPFSPLVTAFGWDVGVGMAAVDALRSILPGCARLHLDASPGWSELPVGSDMNRYRRLVGIALRSMQPPLARVRTLFELSTSEVGELFGVSRQAVEQWQRRDDVPSARREKLANVLSVGELLDRKLGAGRLPLIARRPADVYGGLTMLEMVRDDRDAELLALTERAFDWSGVA